MTGKVLWQGIKALVVCDKNITNVEEEIVATQKNFAAFDKQIDLIKKALEDNKHQLTQGQKKLDFYELQAQTLQDNEVAKRTQLDNIKNQKEYKALEKEISSLSTQRKDLDDLMLRTYHQMELEKNKTAKEKELNEQKNEQLTLDIEALKLLLVTLEEKLISARNERKALAEKIPADWLSRYERMKNNVANPIVSVINECCSSCFYSILYQDMVKLKKSGLLPCRNCYRFLYYDEEEQNDVKLASY